MSENRTISYDKLKALVEINSRINSNVGDSDSLLRSILESAMDMVQCEAASILLLDPSSDTLYFKLSLGPKSEEVVKIPVQKNSIAGWVSDHNKSVIINDVNSDPRFNNNVQKKTDYRTRNMIAFPMSIQNQNVGVIELINKHNNEDFTQEDLTILELLGEQAAIAYRNAKIYQINQNQYEVLHNAFKAGEGYHTFIAKNPQILLLLQNIQEAAETASSVLITGESGVGKELFAEQVHLRSNRKDKPFVRVSCAALNPTLLESELFGHVKGAFTDAFKDHVGRFELADGGTIFLDEIGELPLNLQAKLLRVIQEKKFEKVGSSETVSVDVRIIAATNRNLEQMIFEKTFRSDLYFRLNVLPLSIPPLRERKEEIEDLCILFLNKFNIETHKEFSGFSESAKKALYNYSWPGNIRELENTIERACIIGRPPYIHLSDLRLPVLNRAEDQAYNVNSEYVNQALERVSQKDGDRTLKSALDGFKREYITQILNETNWNQTQAAKILDIQRTYVSKLMQELGIKRS